MEEANAIVLMTDAATGITNLDDAWRKCCAGVQNLFFLL